MTHLERTLAAERENAGIFRRYCEEALTVGDLDLLDELIAPDVVHHTAMPGQAPGLGGLKNVARMLRRGFPDFTIRLQDVLATDDRVAARMTVSGTHRGELGDLAPTGRRVQFDEMAFARFSGGRLVELWSVPDRLALLSQLGVVDTTASAGERLPGGET
jgi:predicted ester cyclase